MARFSKDEIEFQPDAIEIKNEQMPFWLRYSVFSIFFLFAGVIAWSIVCKVDVIVQAQGKLVTNKQPIRMQPLERSVIKEVNVVIGQHVKEGDILFTFDPTINQADVDRLSNDMKVYQARFDRLYAEMNETEYAVPENANEEQREQRQIYLKRQGFYDARIQGCDKEYNAIVVTQNGDRDALKKEEERLAKLKEIESANAPLADKKIMSRQEFLQIQISRMQFEETVDRLRNEIDKLDIDKQTKRSEKMTFLQDWHNKIAEEYVQVRQKLETTRHDYEKAKKLIEFVYLRAPCESVVHQIAAFSPGSAVREAETLITLVPLDGNLEMEAELRPQDVGKVKDGSKVRVKISAFPFQRYGTLDDCVIRDISSDTILREGGGAVQGGAGGSYYRARISISGRLRNLDGELKDGVFQFDDATKESTVEIDDHPFIPGMEATAEIKTDKRRIIEYLVYPLIKAFDESAREP